MELFLRIKTNSNILGSNDMNTTYLALSEVTSIRTDSNGGSIIMYGMGKEFNVPNIDPDELVNTCVVSVSQQTN